MNDNFLTLLTAGFSVALVHAALPTHWLPFVLAGRAQKWSDRKTMMVTGVAGGGHAIFTAVLGALAAVAGAAVDRWSRSLFPWIAGGVLVAFGLFYLWRHVRGGGHGGHDHGHVHGHDHGSRRSRSDHATVLGLIAMLMFSPCEGFFPVYVAGARDGWWGFLWLSAALTVATLGAMLAFTGLALRGLQHLKFERLERYENAIVGGMLVAIGIAVWIYEI